MSWGTGMPQAVREPPHDRGAGPRRGRGGDPLGKKDKVSTAEFGGDHMKRRPDFNPQKGV